MAEELPDAPWAISGKSELPDAPWATTVESAPKESGLADTTMGHLKAAGAGLESAAVDAAGSLGSLYKTAGDVAGPIGQAVVRGIPGAGLVAPFMPTTETVQKKTDEVLGPQYQPQTSAEKFTKTIAEFAPTALAGPGSLLRRGATTLASAIGSEAAGQLTEGTAAEPWARAAGSLVGSAPDVIKGVAKTYPSAAELKASAQHFYKHPVIEGVEIHPQAANRLADDIIADLNKAHLRDKTAPQAYRTVETLRDAAGPTHKIADLDATRQVLGDIAKSNIGSTEQRAANIAVGKIDDFMRNLRQPDLLAGNAARANEVLGAAREDYAAYKRLQRVNDKEYRAQLNAASAYSGTNIDNNTRQAIKQLLLNDKLSHGFTDEELALAERVVTGGLPTSVQNVTRRIAHLLSPTGLAGMHAFIAATAAMLATGSPVGYLAPVIGGTARLTENYLGRKNLRAFEESVANRSRLGRVYNAPQPQTMSPSQAAFMRALLASQGGQ